MKNTRRVIASSMIAGALLAASSLPATVVGASSTRRAQSSSSSSSCKLHVLGPSPTSPAERAAWTKVFSEFDAKYNCTVTATWEGTFTETPQLLNEARLSSEPVDLVVTSTDTWDMASAGELMDLTKLVDPYKKRFEPGVLQPFTISGQLWAVPYFPETLSTFVYNVSLFKKLGLTLPHTFAQLEHAAKVIKQKTNVLPMIEAGKTAWEWPMWYMAAFAQTSGNKSVNDTLAFLSGSQKFTAPDSVDALNDLAAFSKDGILSEKSSLGTNASGAIAAFVQGRAAMMFNGSWVLPTIATAKPTFSVGVSQFPLVVHKSGVVSQENGSPTEGIGIPSFITKAELPMTEKLLSFLSTSTPAKQLQSTDDPIVPSIVGVPAATNAIGATLRSMLPRTNEWLDWLWPSEVTTAVETAIEGVLFNHESAKAAAQSVQKEYETLKTQQHYDYDFWANWTAAQRAAVQP